LAIFQACLAAETEPPCNGSHSDHSHPWAVPKWLCGRLHQVLTGVLWKLTSVMGWYSSFGGHLWSGLRNIN